MSRAATALARGERGHVHAPLADARLAAAAAGWAALSPALGRRGLALAGAAREGASDLAARLGMGFVEWEGAGGLVGALCAAQAHAAAEDGGAASGVVAVDGETVAGPDLLLALAAVRARFGERVALVGTGRVLPRDAEARLGETLAAALEHQAGRRRVQALGWEEGRLETSGAARYVAVPGSWLRRCCRDTGALGGAGRADWALGHSLGGLVRELVADGVAVLDASSVVLALVQPWPADAPSGLAQDSAQTAWDGWADSDALNQVPWVLERCDEAL